MTSLKSQPQRVTPPAQVIAPMKMALDNAPPLSGKPLFAPALKDTRNEIADTRLPRNELTERLVAEKFRGTTSFRPDPPADKRGAVVVTNQYFTERPPGRLRTDQIDALENRGPNAVKLSTCGDWS